MKKLLLFASILAIPFFGNGQTYFSDNFDDGNISDWTVYDQDGDGHNWETVALTNLSPAIASYSYDNATFTPLTPNNYIVSPLINLSTATSAILKFKVKGQDPNWSVEKYSVYAATTNTVAGFLATTPLLTETVTANGPGGVFYTKTIDLSSFAGQPQVYIAFRHHDSTDQFSLHIDDVSITAVPTSAPNCATLNTPANSSTNLSYTSIPLSWTASTTGSAADAYDVYLDQNSNPTTLVATVSGTTYTATNLLPSTTYYWKVVPKNSVGSASGCTSFSFTTMAPTYCTAGATSTSFEKITNVTFADINNNSTSMAGYEDFTSVVGNVKAGSTYTFTASFTGTSYAADHVLVWIDLNNDKDFDDAGEQVLVTPTGKSPWTGSITIPATATIGTTRMRVRLNDSGSSSSNLTPCGTATFGQVEDYTLSIGTMAVSNIEKAQAKVYPNPVKDVLNVESASKVKSLSVYDLSGKAVSSHTLNAVKSQVNLSKLTPGVYIVNIETENGKQSVKVVKK